MFGQYRQAILFDKVCMQLTVIVQNLLRKLVGNSKRIKLCHCSKAIKHEMSYFDSKIRNLVITMNSFGPKIPMQN